MILFKKTMLNIIFFAITLAIICIFFTFGVCYAQSVCQTKDIGLQISIPGLGNKVSGFPQYIEAIYKLFIGIVGIVAVIMIMVGGFQWLIAAGSAQKISGAKTTIISAIMGLVLALTSYTIISLINPKALQLALCPKTLTGEEFDNADGFVPGRYCATTATYSVNDPENYGTIMSSDVGYNCGKIYTIASTNNNFKYNKCLGLGFECRLGQCSVITDYNDMGCEYDVALAGLINYGYPEDYYKEEWMYLNDGNNKYKCGDAIYDPTAGAWIDRGVGTYCDSEQTCVIYYLPGLEPVSGASSILNYSIVKEQSDVVIGHLTGSECVLKNP